ncbi:MAG: ABC transporter permease [Acetatifactor sp.]|nr:ABC transporter permease [Acetatifactor sp.]
MWKFIIKNTLRMLLLLWVVSVVTFAMVEISPIDAVSAYVGEYAVTEQQQQKIAEYWGLNESPVVRYCKWAKNVLHGDMGVSMIYRKNVMEVIGERFGLSIVLMGCAWVLSGLIGLFLGIVAATYQGRLADKAIKVYCLLLESSPSFWIGMLLLIVFSVRLRLFPMGLASPIGMSVSEATLGQRLSHLALPVLTLSFTGISKITLQTREKMIQVLESDYALFAKARGESVWGFVFRHGLRNVLLPFIILHFGSVSELFGGSVLAETVFTYPGLGNATVQSALKGDVPLFLGITLFSTIFVFCGNLAANVLVAVANPQIREGGNRGKRSKKNEKVTA